MAYGPQKPPINLGRSPLLVVVLNTSVVVVDTYDRGGEKVVVVGFAMEKLTRDGNRFSYLAIEDIEIFAPKPDSKKRKLFSSGRFSHFSIRLGSNRSWM